MAETVKVFKNVNTQSAVGAAHSVTLATTSATERAVIKGMSCHGVGNATLDLDGTTILTGETDLVASGSLIMDVSSTLSLKFPYIDDVPATYFKGVLFGDNNDGFIKTISDGETAATPATKTRIPGGGRCSSAFTAVIGGVETFYRYYSGILYAYSHEAVLIESYAFAIASVVGACTDGTYAYAISGTTCYRTHLTTKVSSDFTISSSVTSATGSQSSYLLYHDGNLYSKQNATRTFIDVVNIAAATTSTISPIYGSVGGYSNGGCVVTATSGASYIIEQGNGNCGWINLSDFSVGTIVSGGLSTPAYGNGAAEIAPGIALIFIPAAGMIRIVDMNTMTSTTSASGHGWLQYYTIGNYASFCGLIRKQSLPRAYDAYVSGILISEA